METISITNRGTIRNLLDDVLIDTIENIYALCDLKISYYGVSIAYKNTGQLRKYKRGKILHNYLSNNELERINFFSVPDDFVTVASDYLMEKPYMQEIYTMDKEETPSLYAMGIKNDFKTLKILSSEAVKED